jgi:UDP-N-acetylmuramoylalanine--D-glutamate ligase
MQHSLTWSELAGRRVGLYGLGVEGQANLRACQARGISPILVDDRAQPGVLATSEGGLEALAGCEVVIVSPGISLYSATITTLRDRGVQIVGGLGLWLAGADLDKVICITGTKGKSTTAALTAHLLNEWGYRCLVGGNIGTAPWDPECGDDYDFWVVEVSSYQATSAPVAPPVVVVTSLNPDHLPWHGDVETYYRDKLSLCTRPGARVTVANADSAELVQHAALLGPTVRWVSSGAVADEPWVASVPLLGQHNQRNAVLAATALREAGIAEASDADALARAAATFQPLAHRLTLIDTIDGVRFIDDGLATNVLPTIAALESLPGERVALIVGGHDRGIDYRPLGAYLRDADAEVLVLTTPAVGARMAAEVAESLPGTRSAVQECADLDEAVAAGFTWARPGGIVLLSPAAPSFGVYRDYKDRSDAFVRAAHALAD